MGRLPRPPEGGTRKENTEAAVSVNKRRGRSVFGLRKTFGVDSPGGLDYGNGDDRSRNDSQE
jgi:hypothetical protein